MQMNLSLEHRGPKENPLGHMGGFLKFKRVCKNQALKQLTMSWEEAPLCLSIFVENARYRTNLGLFPCINVQNFYFQSLPPVIKK